MWSQTANFNADKYYGCSPLKVTFTNTSTGTGSSTIYDWNFGDSKTSSLPNPSTTYISPGTYTVSLTVKNGATGKPSTKSATITVYANPSVSFTASPIKSCPCLTTYFTNTSIANAPGIYTSKWSMGDGSIDTSKNPIHTFCEPGKYIVALKITNSKGCEASIIDSNLIEVYEKPKTSFLADKTFLCSLTDSVSFTSYPSKGKPPYTYLWDFGDGSPSSSLPNPTHKYTTYGLFNVKLIVTDANGCKDTNIRFSYINNQTLNTDFVIPSSVCPGITPVIFFNNSSPSPIATKWKWSDITTTSSDTSFISRAFWKGGTYTLTKVDSFSPGCRDTAVKTYNVYPKPQADFSYSPIYPCPSPVDITFTNKGPATDSYKWYFGDDSTSTDFSPVHTYLKDTIYFVYLVQTNMYGCKDTFRVRDTTKDFPDGYASKYYDSANSPIIMRVFDMQARIYHIQHGFCIPLKVDFSVSLRKTIKLPSLPDTLIPRNVDCDFIKTYDLPFRYCTQILGFDDPYPDPYPDTSYLVKKPHLYPVPITSYTWDFGDGSPISTDSTPTHYYTKEGEFYAKCTTITANGCTSIDSVLIQAGDSSKPFIDDTSMVITCAVDSISIFVKTIGAITSTIDWGDTKIGSFIDSATLKHKYPGPGKYLIKVTASRHGCDVTTTKLITVPGPLIDFSPKYNCDTVTKVFFKNLSSRASSFKWFFGDGDTSTEVSPTHKYPDTGVYHVLLTAIDTTSNCVDTSDVYVHLFYPSPKVTFTPVCTNDTIFINIENRRNVDSFYWKDNSFIQYDEERELRYMVFKDTGVYDFILPYVFFNSACVDEINMPKSIVIARPQVKPYTKDKIKCFPDVFDFIDSSTNTQGVKNVLRIWNFPDTTITTRDSSLSKGFSAPAKYSITLNVKDTVGCISKKTFEVESRKPKADFTALVDTFSCIGKPIKFFTKSEGISLKYYWDFGDSSSSTSATPIHAYSKLGTYDVSLIVEDNYGCRDTIVKKKFIIITKPIASFNPTDSVALCPPLFTTLINTSTNAVSYQWDFDNENASIITSPSTVYINKGLYNIQLIVFDKHGCPDTAYKQVKVMGYDGVVKYKPLEGCAPLKVSFNADVDSFGIMVLDFGNGETQNVGKDFVLDYEYMVPGKYLPRLIMSDDKGCGAVSLGLDTIVVDAVKAKWVNTPTCINEWITFKDSSISYFSKINSIKWYFSSKDTSILDSVYKRYDTLGTYPLKLVVSNINHCLDTLDSTFTIFPLPNIVAQDTVICLGDKAMLSAHGGISYNWIGDTTLNCLDCNNPITNSKVSNLYFVYGKDKNGCVNMDTLSLGIKTKSTIYSKDTSVCEKEPIMLWVAGAQTYNWSPAQYLNDRTIARPIATLDSSIIFTIVGYEGSCIPDTTILSVIVYPRSGVNAGSDQKILAGSTVQLNAVGKNIKSYKWSPNTTLSCSDCANPIAKPIYTTIYTVVATTDYGCIDADSVTITIFCDNEQLFLPNTFTPNGDGQNDYFYPQGKGVQKLKKMIIYNRWGQKVYDKTDIDVNIKEQGWDGTFSGEILKPDTYVYYIEAYCDNGELFTIKGDINLIR